jgi:3-methyladenine DNA glycosylase AlkD
MFEINKKIEEKRDLKRAIVSKSFFKTAKGEYGEGDIFIGISVPESRAIAKDFLNLNFKEIKTLLNDKIHEKRLIALIILVEKFNRANKEEKRKIFKFYLENRKFVNNWDLVDLSADKIIGNFIYNFGKEYPNYEGILRKFAKSKNLWDRRISIISTFFFIKQNYFKESIYISRLLIKDDHDLIHKAVGWVLREIGNRNKECLENFLKKHYEKMPRTMLRYSIEKFNKKEKKKYLNGKI